MRYVEDKTMLIPIEQFYLDMYLPEYNICKRAGTGNHLGISNKNKYWLGKKHTKESIQKMRLAKQGIKRGKYKIK